jgi:gliding motility-associated-like protein
MNPDTPTFLNPDVQFTDLSIGNGISAWYWSFGNGDISSDKDPFYAFTDTGLYAITLKVTDINGCSDTATKSIFLTPILKFFMPNAFYPNNNGRNDIYRPGGVFQGINDYTISIYNRWGELIYSGTDPIEGWDGTFGGKTCPNGVYIYKIRYTDYTRSKWFNLIGDLTLFR